MLHQNAFKNPQIFKKISKGEWKPLPLRPLPRIAVRNNVQPAPSSPQSRTASYACDNGFLYNACLYFITVDIHYNMKMTDRWDREVVHRQPQTNRGPWAVKSILNTSAHIQNGMITPMGQPVADSEWGREGHSRRPRARKTPRALNDSKTLFTTIISYNLSLRLNIFTYIRIKLKTGLIPCSITTKITLNL